MDRLRPDFYLLPILDVEEVFLSSAMRKVKLVEIASIPLQEETPREELPFSAGIVFVIDTTTSMDPYIDRTRETVRRIFDRIKASPIGSQVGFGLIGFRDNSAAVEYAAKVFAPLAYPPNHEEFQRQSRMSRRRAPRPSVGNSRVVPLLAKEDDPCITSNGESQIVPPTQRSRKWVNAVEGGW